MQIDLDLLISQGAVAKKYKKDEVVFEEAQDAHFYYQIMDGSVRMYNLNEEGKEFTQGLFCKGESFGSPPLFIDQQYPSKAVCIQDCTIIKLSKDKFLNILDQYPLILKSFLILLANKIHSKATTSKAIINQKPEFRIIAFMNNHKIKTDCCPTEKVLIPYTRQQIANYTGLRVETVIRTFIKMNACSKVEIINHKIFY